MSKISKELMKAAAGGGGGEGEATFPNVTLLLDGDGPSLGDNGTFTDSSPNSLSVTRSNTVGQGSFSPYGSLWSLDLSNTTSYTSTYSAQGHYMPTFGDGLGAFTLEFWYMPLSVSSGNQVIMDNDRSGGTGSANWFELSHNGSDFTISHGGAGSGTTTIGSFFATAGTWYHIAITREASTNTINVFRNGVSVTTYSDSNSFGGASGRSFYIGTSASGNPDTCFVSNFRIINGSALYTSGFTVPTEPLTEEVGTVWLAGHRNNFIEDEGGLTLSPQGTARVVSFSPFRRAAALDMNTGGSAIFDGINGSQLIAASSRAMTFGTADFTFECWLYLNQYTGSFSMIADQVSSNRYFAIDGGLVGTPGRMAVWTGVSGSDQYSSATDTQTLELGCWNHLVWQRESGTLYMYINGVRVYNATYNYDFGTASDSIRIGFSDDYSSYYLDGHITDVRSYFGGVAYTGSPTTITVPTGPLGNVGVGAGGTDELRLNFKDAEIFDRTGINNLIDKGNTKLSTSIKKYGVSSIAFDGTGDHIQLQDGATSGQSLFQFLDNNFTVEGWVYFNSLTNNPGVFQLSNSYLGSVNRGPAVGVVSNNWAFIHGTTLVTPSAPVSINTWYFVSVSRNNGTTRFFVDGSLISSAADSTNYTDRHFIVGGWSTASTSSLLNGYIDDFRVTKGLARYVSGFTPPPGALAKF